jgi:hypothetical protein
MSSATRYFGLYLLLVGIAALIGLTIESITPLPAQGWHVALLRTLLAPYYILISVFSMLWNTMGLPMFPIMSYVSAFIFILIGLVLYRRSEGE